MKNSRTQLFWSIAFLLGSIALWVRVAPIEEPPKPVPVVAEAVSQFQVEGVWEQYSVDLNGRRQLMARLDLRSHHGQYIAYPTEISTYTYPKHPYLSFDHEMTEDGTWTFREEWDHNGDVGEFYLKRQANGEYRGIASSTKDGSAFDTVFVRVR